MLGPANFTSRGGAGVHLLPPQRRSADRGTERQAVRGGGHGGGRHVTGATVASRGGLRCRSPGGRGRGTKDDNSQMGRCGSIFLVSKRTTSNAIFRSCRDALSRRAKGDSETRRSGSIPLCQTPCELVRCHPQDKWTPESLCSNAC